MHYLTWYDKTTEKFIGECLMLGVSNDDIKKIFNIDQEYIDTILPVQEQHVQALEQAIPTVNIRLDIFDYCVQLYQSTDFP